MAVDTATEANDSNDRWYVAGPPEIEDETRELLEKYSGLAPDQVLPHAENMRDKAWEICPYPCIGFYMFLDFVVSQQLPYEEVVQRLKAGDQYLDLACCVGQDIRKLIFDGVPKENVRGFELEKSFVDMGFELFRDRDRMESNFMVGDFFDPNSPLKDLEGAFDIIQSSMFFHLFNWEKQVQVISSAIRLLKPKPGSLIFGNEVGAREADLWKNNPLIEDEGMFRHNEESYQRLWEEIGRVTGTKWEVRAVLDFPPNWEKFGPTPKVENVYRLRYAARRQ